jgi:hypothetical protein
MLRMWKTQVSQRWMADRTNLKSNSGIRPGGAVRVRFLQEKECPAQGQSICYGYAAHVEHACLTEVDGRPDKLEVKQRHQARRCCESQIPAGERVSSAGAEHLLWICCACGTRMSHSKGVRPTAQT